MTNSDCGNDDIADARAILRALDRKSGSFSEGNWKPGYEDMVASIGDILLRVNQDDYQGDTWCIVQSGTHYGYVNFGWGSCSGCDALEGTNTWEEYYELRDNVANGTHWENSARELLEWFKTHDWGGDYTTSSTDSNIDFVPKAIKLLERLG